MQLIKLIRIKHWVKNFFLFIPLFFAGQMTHADLYVDLILSFFSFGLVASSVYIINDMKDLENDRLHPVKKFRPLASGEVSLTLGWIIFTILMISGFGLAIYLKYKFAFVLGIYFLMNVAYALGLKKISILDIIILAIGFVLRIKAGAIITDIALSQWIVVMVFLLAIFLAIAKRRDDTVIKESSGLDMRAVSKKYSLDFLNIALSLVAGVIFVSYLMYCLSDEVMHRMGTDRLFYTSIFVFAGLMRYLQIALVENNTGSPTDLLYTDRFIQTVLVLWGFSFYLLIYFNNLSLFA